MTMNNQTMHTPARLDGCAGAFQPFQRPPWASCICCGCPWAICYTLRPACPLCVPVRPVAGFYAVRGFLTTQGIKTPYGANLTACGIGQKESPGRLSTCPGLYGLSEFQAGFLALPVGHKGGYIVRGLHGDIVQGQPVRGHVVALTIPGEKFATLHA